MRPFCVIFLHYQLAFSSFGNLFLLPLELIGQESNRLPASNRTVSRLLEIPSFFCDIYWKDLSLISVSTTSSRHNFEPYGGRIEVSGTYRLQNYDKKFDDYLLSLDIPQQAIGMIRASKEMITVTEPTNANPNWTLTMRTGAKIFYVHFSI